MRRTWAEKRRSARAEADVDELRMRLEEGAELERQVVVMWNKIERLFDELRRDFERMKREGKI